MSAYICEKRHILYLVQSATSPRIVRNRSPLRWVWDYDHATRTRKDNKLAMGDYDKVVEVANMLWRENVASVSARYPRESSGTLPGPRGGSFVITITDICRPIEPTPEPVQVLKACDCYYYQSCEHSEWEQSEAFAFIQTLRSAAWHSLPGYEDAKWGAPDEPQRKALSLA